MADEDIDSLLAAGIKAAAQETKDTSGDAATSSDESKPVIERKRSDNSSRRKSSRRSRSRSPASRSTSRSPRRSSRRRDRERRRHSRSRSESRSTRRRSTRRSRSRSRSAPRTRRSSRRSRSRSRSPRHTKPKSSSTRSRSRSRSAAKPKSKSPRKRSTSAERAERAKQRELMELTRDHRTIFVGQLTQKVRERDLETYFGALGALERVLLIRDKFTNRSKGFAYVELSNLEDVPRALLLHGRVPTFQTFPLLVKASEAEKNFAAKKDSVIITAAAAAAEAAGPTSDASTTNRSAGSTGPNSYNNSMGHVGHSAAALSAASRIYCGNLHAHITEDDLRSVCQAFGDVVSVTINRDETGRSRGFGFVQFHTPAEASLALAKGNGLELAGNQLRLGHVNEHTGGSGSSSYSGPNSHRDGNSNSNSSTSWKLEDDEGRGGLSLNAQSRAALMAKLAGGRDLFPSTASAAPTQPALVSTAVPGPSLMDPTAERAAALAAVEIDGAPSFCFVIKNMFDAAAEARTGSIDWDVEIKQDVEDECATYGRVLHSFVAKDQVGGLVYVLFDTVASAEKAAQVLHGRWFNARQISVRYLSPQEYVGMFPEVRSAVQAAQAGVSSAQY